MKKYIVLGIVILFVGASVLSSVSGDIKNLIDIDNWTDYRNNGFRLDLGERINCFRGKVLKLDQSEKLNSNLFGDPKGWTPTELVSSESTDNSTWCSIAVDDSGDIHVVWQDETDYSGSGSDFDIFYKMKPSGGSWTAAEVVSSESSIDSDVASLAVEPDGTVHVTWDDYSETTSDVYYKMKPNGGSWTAAELISIGSSDYSGYSSLAVESDGTVHVAMNGITDIEWEYDVYYKMKPSGGSWTAAEHVSDDAVGYAYIPSLAVESDGSVHVAWEEWDGGYILDVYYKMKPNGGSWTAAEAVTQTSTESFSPSLAVDQDSNVHVVWPELSPYDFLDVCYKMKPDGGSWSSTDILSSTSYSMMIPSITVDPDGTVHVVFDEIDLYSFYVCIFYRNKPSSGSWSSTELVTDDFDGDAFSASVVVDQSGVVHVAWEGYIYFGESSSYADIFYKNNDYVNLPPESPTITGETNGNKGEEYEYTFASIDPNGNKVYYFIDWGDNTTEDWIGPYNSSENATVTHTWDDKGTYIIKSKAKDVYGAESDWSELEVTMPKNQNMWFLRWLERFPILQRLLSLPVFNRLLIHLGQ